jgi:uncharacterized membrane protein
VFLYYFSIGMTVVSNALYHVVQKLTPASVNPLLALTMTYATATIICLVLLPVFPLGASLADSLRQLNWASFALAITVVGLELGFILAYRAGWNISLGAIVSNVAVTLLLIPVGLLFFQERLSAVNVVGVAVCVVGLVMVNLR